MIRKNILAIVFQMLIFVGIVGNVVYATENNYEMTEETRQMVNEAILDFPDEENL